MSPPTKKPGPLTTAPAPSSSVATDNGNRSRGPVNVDDILAAKAPPAYPQNHLGTLAELLTRTIEPIRWVVDGLVPEGLTFLAGRPKMGKSWLTMSMALAVCAGHEFFGRECPAAIVLYVSLEDGDRRIQERVRTLGGGLLDAGSLGRFHYQTEWQTLDRGGLTRLEEWMTLYPSTRLIVVDTYGRVRGDLPGKDRYSEEYALLGGLQGFAMKHGVAVVMVHHLRKQGADDWLEQLSGSQAVTGSADTLLGLYRERGRMDATLRTVSRDADELELALRFENGKWTYLGPAAEYRLSEERQTVLDALRDLGGEAKVSDVATLVEKSNATVSKLLVKLAGDGLVRKVRYGHYALGEVVEVGEPPPSTSTTSTTSTTQYEGKDFPDAEDDPLEVGRELIEAAFGPTEEFPDPFEVRP